MTYVLWLSKESVERRRIETITGSGGGGHAAAAAEDPGVEERKQSTLTEFWSVGSSVTPTISSGTEV